MAEQKTPWTPEQHAEWLIKSINSYRESTGRDPLSKQFEEEIQESMRERLGGRTKEDSEE